MSNLAPCPDCGVSTAIIEFECGVALRCDGCGSGVYGCDEDEALATWNRRVPALRWRREPPDVPGWWWRQHRDDPKPSILDYSDVECERLQASPLSRTHWRWAGPIPEPEEGEA